MPDQIILLIEDDQTLRFLAKRQFERLGVICDTAANGLEGVEMSKKGYSMIFMDISMPEMNGIGATYQIREYEKNEGRERTPIIGLSAFSNTEDCKNAGMDDFIQKPMMLEQAQEMLAKYQKK